MQKGVHADASHDGFINNRLYKQDAHRRKKRRAWILSQCCSLVNPRVTFIFQPGLNIATFNAARVHIQAVFPPIATYMPSLSYEEIYRTAVFKSYSYDRRWDSFFFHPALLNLHLESSRACDSDGETSCSTSTDVELPFP